METAPPRHPAQLSFHDATDADVPALVELIESAYRGDSSRAGWTTEADILDGQRTDPEGVRQVIGASGSRLLVVRRGDEMVACCQLEHRGDAAYFGMFAVRPGLQGGGLGRLVITEAERLVREAWGVTEMHMTVISVREELLAWYERRGYRGGGAGAHVPTRAARGGGGRPGPPAEGGGGWGRERGWGSARA
ncbi:GNAT family N-acetyltransferase, partial [Streptomyces sp. NPDC059018]|uniref:GNAT family N-acetyltransferase n=1 Tax=Streptomyces sp. NPDC059018 TaxID=3346701 RepID=UPI003686CEA6